MLGSLGQKRRFVAVIDEFPYLLAAAPALASIIQNLWDRSLRRSKLCLILCGSQVGVMESEVLGQTGPLYGRRTGQWQVGPLAVHDIARFFPAYSPEDVIRTYGIVGGMPAYVTQFDPEAPLAENVIRHILSRGTFLYDEVDFLLMQGLRDVARYHAALSALAAGTTQLHEIARQHVWRLTATGSLSIIPDHVGTWWDREEELDVVAVRHETREAWLAECMWSSSLVHPRELDELTRKAAHFQTRTGYVPRGLGLFSRGPFHPDLRARGGTADLLLVGPADLVRAAP
jgi:AAA+ ATPase superfamily predicted ATPase